MERSNVRWGQKVIVRRVKGYKERGQEKWKTGRKLELNSALKPVC